MSLKSMHEEIKSKSMQENSLIEQQSQRITELMQEKEQDSRLITQQSEKIEELQNELAEQIQKSSSSISELKSEMLKLARKNERLNGADVVLKQNEKLQIENGELKKNIQKLQQETEATISAVKREYTAKYNDIMEKEQRVNALQDDLSNEITKQASELIQDRISLLQSAYEGYKRSCDMDILAHKTLLIGSILYGILITLLTAIRSTAFLGDFKAFCLSVWNCIDWCYKSAISVGKWMAQIGDIIPQPIVAIIVHWIIQIIVTGGMWLGLSIVITKPTEKWWKWFRKNQADIGSLAVLLVSLALIIFLADIFKSFLPINLILLLILIQLVAMGIRAFIQSRS